MSRNGTPIQRVRERARVRVPLARTAAYAARDLELAGEKAEAAQVAAAAAAVAATAVDGRVDDVLDGTEDFTGLNVGGTDVKPFLDKTDGDKLTDASGLDTAIVSTAAIQLAGASSYLSAFTDTAQTLSTTEQNCQGVTFTTTGESLEVFFSFYLNVWHPAGGSIDTTLRLYRQGTLIWDFVVEATGGDFAFGWQSVVVTDQPAAGSYLYQLTTQVSVATFSTATASSRFLSVTERKR
jgi:hypothetical protein